MGCYLSRVDDRVYINQGRGRNFDYCTASCQGWRREQEDAEVCLTNFDTDASLFILCDGHGGAEVAKYTVKHLPDFIKNHPLYREAKYEELLTSALIDFDAHLRTDEVMAELERLAKDDDETLVPMDSDAPNKLDHNEAGDAGPAPTAGGSSSLSSSHNHNKAGTSGAAGNGACSSVVEDVDTETLRREAQLPLEALIVGYADRLKTSSSSLAPKQPGGGDEKSDETPRASGSGSNSDQLKPSSSLDGQTEELRCDLRDGVDSLKSAVKRYFDDLVDDSDDSDDDSEYEESEDDSEDEEDTNDDDDEDDEDDGDDERDEETSGKRNKKLFSKKLKKRTQVSSSSSDDDDEEEEEEEEDDDDDDDEEDDDDDSEEDESGEEDEDNGFDDQSDPSDPRAMFKKMLSAKLNSGTKVHKPGMDSGCTVVVALIKGKELYVGSAGDSRCIVVMRDGQCKPMSFDHKPEDAQEHRRITRAGGTVCDGRVNGGLNLSRALGDFTYKNPKLDAKDQMITPCPDVRVTNLDPDQVEFVFLACDGIWNSMKNNQVAKFILKAAPAVKYDLSEVCISLFKQCIARTTDGDGTGCDNMTCIIVRYDNSSETSTNNQTSDLKDTKEITESVGNGDEPCGKKQSNKRPSDPDSEDNPSTKRKCVHLWS